MKKGHFINLMAKKTYSDIWKEDFKILFITDVASYTNKTFFQLIYINNDRLNQVFFLIKHSFYETHCYFKQVICIKTKDYKNWIFACTATTFKNNNTVW